MKTINEKNIKDLIDLGLSFISQEERKIIILRFFENKSLENIGKIFKISRQTAKRRIDKALLKLKSEIEKIKEVL